MTKPKPHAPPEKVELYDRMVGSILDVERRGAANPYTSINGNMFSQLLPSGRVSLKLPSDERDRFIEIHKARLVEQYGVVQKEYVEVPDALLARFDEIDQWFRVSYEYARTLRPKPSKRSRET